MKILFSSYQVLLDSIIQIEEYIKGYTFDEFINDQKTMDAVLMQLQHIGESTRKIVDNFGDIDFLPTNEMVGLRNFIAHNYLGISKKIIWETIVQDLPEIKHKLENYMKKNK